MKERCNGVALLIFIAMAGYNVKDTKVYTPQGTALKLDQLTSLLCAVCGFVLRESMQVTRCGHRFCKVCIDKMLNTGGDDSFRCPVDKEHFERAEVRKDRGCQREIGALEVDCPTRPDPCSWRGPLVEIEVHRLKCTNALVSCTLKCGMDLRREELAPHLTKDCPKREVVCQHCKKGFASDSIESHFVECEEFPVACDYCQLIMPNRKSIQKHLQNECQRYDEMKCPMNCPKDFKGDRESVNSHLKDHLLDMSRLLNTALSRIEALETKITQVLEESNRERVEMHKEITELKKAMRNGQTTNTEKSPTAKLVAKNESTNGSVSVSNSLQPLSVPTVKNGAHNSAVTRWEEPGTGRREDAGMREEMRSQETRLMNMSETLQTVQSNLTQHSIAIDEVRLRQDILDVKVTNGALIWKIPDFRRRYRDAIDRRTISLYSPPFYTSPHGYRMCIRTYLNGDGIGNGTHISLFFVVMRSEHDNLLPWPFKQSVRFTLINQMNPGASVSEAFVPDIKSSSFQKPENDMNVASGFPKFARQSVLQDEQFTLGNMIYIKCQVDITGLKLD